MMTTATPHSFSALSSGVHAQDWLSPASLMLAGLLGAVLGALLCLRHLRRHQQRLHDTLTRLGEAATGGSPRTCDDMLDRLQTTMARLEHAARHDPMTGLLNSGAFKLAIQTFLATCHHADTPSLPGLSARRHGALLLLGINELRKVNETLGHAAGDQLLLAVADRLRLATATPDPAQSPIMGRLGGDEFALFLPGHTDRGAMERFIQRLQRVIGEACHVGTQSFRVKLSVGIALSGDHGQQYDQMLAAADTAMQHAGPASHCFYTPEMRVAADQMLAEEMALRNALEQGEFCLHYQPQLNLVTGAIDSVEALIRWNHPTRGLVHPIDFIPFAEANGLIDDIGDWVILEAARTAARWHQSGLSLRMSVNVSPRQLWRVELIPMVRACLTRFALPPHLFEIEITEAAIMRDEDFCLQRIEGLRRDGVSVALDDFGTGYSNLAQLMALPMDRLKLDRSLVESIVTDPRKQVVVTSIIRMGRDLGFDVVAEGVETAAQLDILRKAGCHSIQGYHLSRPVNADALLRLIGVLRKNPESRVA
jgi:diguanylate cyclase (GGDEF)-like protein